LDATIDPRTDAAPAHPAGACPMHAPAPSRRALAADDVLVFPFHKRVVTRYAADDAGVHTLFLYYGDKEISFDEPALFGFGETLAGRGRFVAGEACAWGESLDWPQVRALLEQLIDEGILHHGADELPSARPIGDLARPSPLPPAPCATPRSWTECAALTEDLTGLSLEIGHLEMVMPIFRVAHIALDAEGRQVGEANVFPKALRLDTPTRWRTCIYPGTRHQSERPMNVSALKSMRQHWPQMMAMLHAMRAAYLARFPQAAQGWTVGHLERLSTAVLALPTLLLMRADGHVDNGRLHPALSSLFRVTDGLRMTMHQMLFVPIGEPTLAPDAPMTAAEIVDYAERNYSFHSEHGVCAGPRSMVEEFLAVLVDGRLPASGLPAALDPEIVQALEAVETALDYGLLGLKVYAAVFSLWPAMTRSYVRLADIAGHWNGPGSTRLNAIRERLAGHLDVVERGTYLATEAWRADREAVYADMDRQCGLGLGDPADGPGLDLRLAAQPASQVHTLAATLANLLRERLECRAAGDTLDLARMAGEIAAFLVRVQAVLREALGPQRRINALLGRAQPRRPFGADALDLHNRLQGSDSRRLPYLVHEIEALLRIRITLDAQGIAIDPHTTQAAA
jgi:hypothetical protein